MKAKNILKTLALPVAVALGMMATSCSSDDNIVNEQQAGAAKHEIPVTVSATRSGDDATRATFNETSKKLEFEEGDQLFIQGTDATAGTFAGVLSNTSGAPGTFSGTVTTQNTYTGTFSALFGSATSLTATLLPKDYSTEAYGYLTLSGEGASQTLTVDATKAFVTAASADAAKALAIEQLSLEQTTTYSSGFTLTPVNAVLNYSISGLANSTGYTPSVSDAATTISGSVTSDASGNAYFAVAFAPAGSKTYTLSISGFSDIAVADRMLTAGMVYKKTATAAVPTPAVPEGAISGKFSVSATKQVYFSKGNLRYASGTWSFFDNQYDYYTSYSAGAWDKFGWSTSTTNYGMNTSTSNSTYSGNFVDWGATMGSGWRTLTGGEDGGEWEYIFNTRTTTSGIRYAKAQVNSVAGVILLPDDWSNTYYALNSTNTTDADFTTNEISASDWTSKLEANGCVFLPAAGYRDYGTMVKDVGDYGDYWSSTAKDSEYAYDVYFDSYNVGPQYNWERHYGFSVRLVRDVE